jgi:hypothetical protein
MSSDSVSIVTTAWNERENIEKLVLTIKDVLQRVQREIIVVDDTSPDGTIQTASRVVDVAVTKRTLRKNTTQAIDKPEIDSELVQLLAKLERACYRVLKLYESFITDLNRALQRLFLRDRERCKRRAL